MFILMWWFLPPLLYAGTSDTSVKAVTDTRTALLAGLLGVGALGTLWINSHNVGLTAEIHAHTVKDATERRVTELSTKAADQLGSDKAPVPDLRNRLLARALICLFVIELFPKTAEIRPGVR